MVSVADLGRVPVRLGSLATCPVVEPLHKQKVEKAATVSTTELEAVNMVQLCLGRFDALVDKELDCAASVPGWQIRWT